jgi:hypothetical protein
MKNPNEYLPLVALGCSLLSSIFTAGGVYAVVMWRIKKLEEDREDGTDNRERIIRLETKIDFIVKQTKLQ